jgi:hypothetical protein
VLTERGEADEIVAEVAAAEGVEDVYAVHYMSLYDPHGEDTFGMTVLDCAAMRAVARIDDCTDGDVLLVDDGYTPLRKDTRYEWREYPRKSVGDWSPEDYEVTGTWMVPPDARTVRFPPGSGVYGSVFVTPGALDPATLPDGRATVFAMVGPGLTEDQMEGIRNAVAGHRFDTYVLSLNTGPDLNDEQETFVAIRTALYAGSIFTLMLAGVSLLVLALEHIRERRRTLAMLTASGVPRGVLGRSLLWQVALPIALGTVVALATGLGLAALVMRLVEETMVVDWAGVALLSAGAVALSLMVSAMTMPFLRNATRLTALRTE